MRNLYANKTLSEKIVHTIVFFIFLAFAFSYLYIIFWCLVTSFRDFNNIATTPFGFKGFSFSNIQNYLDVIPIMKEHGKNFYFMLLNSLYFNFLGSLINIFITATFAYVTTKYRFFGSKAPYFIVLIMITLPLYGTSSAQYKLLYNSGIMNSRFLILTSCGGFSMFYLYFHSFYSNLSWSYGEAAEIDGANEWQIFFKVMFPQTITMFGALFLMLWIADWNSYSSALIYLQDYPTVAVGIYLFKVDTQYESNTHILFAACVIALLPPLILFCLCNKAIMNNVSLGGIKE